MRQVILIAAVAALLSGCNSTKMSDEQRYHAEWLKQQRAALDASKSTDYKPEQLTKDGQSTPMSPKAYWHILSLEGPIDGAEARKAAEVAAIQRQAEIKAVAAAECASHGIKFEECAIDLQGATVKYVKKPEPAPPK